MFNAIETHDEAAERRRGYNHRIDFTMMYVAHDAFSRDMRLLLEACQAGDGLAEAAIETWRFFNHQLHVHHTAEDEALWPALQKAATSAGQMLLLAEMKAEHAEIDPLIEEIDLAIHRGDSESFTHVLSTLAERLGSHMRHEEAEALALVDSLLGEQGWSAFSTEIRSRIGGLGGGATYLPWVLDGGDEATRDAVLKMIPLPARALFRRVWEPKHRASGRLGSGAVVDG